MRARKAKIMAVDIGAQDRRLYIEIITNCQLACRYCFYETGLSVRRKDRNSPEQVRDLVAGGLAEWFGQVTLTGGEVLLDSSIWESIDILSNAGLDVGMITDGVRLDPDARSRLYGSSISRIAISLDSLSPEVQDATRVPRNPRRGGGATLLENLRSLAIEKPPALRVAVLQTVHRANLDSILPLLTWCTEAGFDVLVHPVGLPDVPAFDDLRLESCTEHEMARLQQDLLTWAGGNLSRRGFARAAMEFVRGRRPSGIRCGMGRETFFLDAEGNLSPCFHRTDLTYGNVRQQSLRVLMPNLVDHHLATAPCASLACSCLLDCDPADVAPGSIGALPR